jgi:protocatechuate 3,4-dioxygenase beta subunit
MRRAVLTFTILLATAMALGAQAPTPGQPVTPRTPARDRQVAKGTAVIRGHVLDAASGAPIRRARVMVFARSSPVTSQTDADGRFELREVPAGKHTLNVSKTGYLSLFATNNNKPLPPLEVKDGEVIERIVVRLARGGVVTGQVLDEFGEPFVGAQVRAMRYRYSSGQRQLMPASQFGGGFQNVFTDDLGAFRLYGLEPGEYYIVAQGGREFMPFGPAAAAPSEGPAQTYYPGTGNVAEARRVAVRAGRETQGVVFPIALARMSRVRGRVVTSNGEPFTGGVSVAMKDVGGGMSSYGSSVRPDSTFEVNNLAPGTYTLTARQNDYPGSGADIETGRVVVTVNGEELNDVVIATSRGATARGRIVTDDGTPASAISTSFNLMVRPVEPGTSMMGRIPSKVTSDGVFEITGLFDRVHLRPGFMSPPNNSTGASWTLKAVLVDGQDVTDSGLDVRPGQVIENIDIVYTRKVSRVSGQLKNSRGEQATGWIVAFSSDEARWTPQSRYVRVSRPGPDGQYRLTLTPHDDYLMIGVDGIEDGQWQDPEFLRSVKDLATRFAIGENETKVQDVTVVEWRR